MSEKTQAEQVSALLDDDGLEFEAEDGRSLDDLCKAYGARHTSNDICDDHFSFADGSAISVHGGAWDIGYPDCGCWRDNVRRFGHECARASVHGEIPALSEGDQNVGE